jgi:hypothetical protein
MAKFTIDFDSLKKGDELSTERLEEMLGKKANTDEFRFAVMSVQSLIQERTGYTVKCGSDCALRILTDAEASEHNQKLFQQNLRAIANRHALNCQVDVDNLSEDQRKKHDRALMVQSRYVGAIVQTTRNLAAVPKRKMLGPGDESST